MDKVESKRKGGRVAVTFMGKKKNLPLVLWPPNGIIYRPKELGAGNFVFGGRVEKNGSTSMREGGE